MRTSTGPGLAKPANASVILPKKQAPVNRKPCGFADFFSFFAAQSAAENAAHPADASALLRRGERGQRAQKRCGRRSGNKAQRRRKRRGKNQRARCGGAYRRNEIWKPFHFHPAIMTTGLAGGWPKPCKGIRPATLTRSESLPFVPLALPLLKAVKCFYCSVGAKPLSNYQNRV